MNTTAVEMAKEKVAKVFAALSAHPDTKWNELVRGGFEAQTSITTGVLTGYVGYDGEFAVYAGKFSTPRMLTLISGTFAGVQTSYTAPSEAGQSIANGPSEKATR